VDLHFHDLRGTAVTRLALAGCTVPQIAAITGHSPRDVDKILKAHHLGGQDEASCRDFDVSSSRVLSK
jgi:integrase